MKRIFVFPALVVLATLTSCAGLPKPDDGKTAILAIPVKTVGQGMFGLAYSFGVKESAERLYVNPTDDVLTFSRLPPGSYTIVDVMTTLGPGAPPGSTYMGDSTPQALRAIPFTLVGGCITILPVTVEIYQEATEGRTYQTFKFVLTDRSAAISALSKKGNFSSWKLAN